MADPANTGIYEIVNTVNGKRYIGSSVDLRRRELQHFGCLARGNHHNCYLQSAWLKYGPESFKFSVIERCAASEIVRAEQAAFERLKPEYNLAPTAGNLLGFKFSVEACLRKRGRKRSAESVEKTAMAHRGMKRSDETRAKLSKAAAGSKKPPRPEEYRAKISAALKGKQKSPEHMAKLQEGRRLQKFTDERRAAISSSLIAAYADGRKSRERPQEYRDKISSSLRGKKLSPEHRANVSAAMRGKKRGPYNLNSAGD